MYNTSTLNYNTISIIIGGGGAEIILLLFVYSLIVVFYKNDDGSDVKIKQQRKSDLIYVFIYMTKDNL
jgi:hypothetical protein